MPRAIGVATGVGWTALPVTDFQCRGYATWFDITHEGLVAYYVACCIPGSRGGIRIPRGKVNYVYFGIFRHVVSQRNDGPLQVFYESGMVTILQPCPLQAPVRL